MFNRTRFAIAIFKNAYNLYKAVDDFDDVEKLLVSVRKWNLDLADDYARLLPKGFLSNAVNSKKHTKRLVWLATKVLELKPDGRLKHVFAGIKTGGENSLVALDAMIKDIEEMGPRDASRKFIHSQYGDINNMLEQARKLRILSEEISKPMAQA